MDSANQSELPKTCLPQWSVEELPEPKPLGFRNLAGLIGPGIVMCGIQIGGGEWLFGPDVTAKYGGGLMWIATVAIVLQVFYNMECGRYALYTGEPVFTGFMRTMPGPAFWIGVSLLLNSSALIPGLSTNAAVLIVALYLDKPPTPDDKWIIDIVSLVLLGLVVLPVLIGGKVYNMLQAIMTMKVIVVLGFCLLMGVLFVPLSGWLDVFSGFVEFGNVPTKVGDKEVVVNAVGYRMEQGVWPLVALANIAMLGAFAGYAGGGGLSNSTYSNFVRDKGWGMGSKVGAIPSAIGGRSVTLSHLGKVFLITSDNLRKWRGWWKYILWDQLFVWAPGCFMGMALPALLSIGFASSSPMFVMKERPAYSQPLIVADGMRHSFGLDNAGGQAVWIVALIVGLFVFLPSQVSIVDDFTRRWTDIIWSGVGAVRNKFKEHQIKHVYYALMFFYVVWSFIVAIIFLRYPDSAKTMVTVIANFNNLAIGFTAFHILWINLRFLPRELRPRWYSIIGITLCGTFYLGLAALVFQQTTWPIIDKWLRSWF